MPSYNQGKFIERSILSVINQDYKNYELIVIDGGSTDETVNIIAQYEKHVAYWVSEPDNGQSNALNKALSRCSGNIICWLNTDDLFTPHAFLEAVNAFQKYPYAKVVYADWAEIDEYDQSGDYYYAFDYSLHHLIYEGFMMNAQSMFWKKEVGLQFDEQLHRTMDYDYMIRLGLELSAKEIVRVDACWGYFRRHPGQKTLGLDDKVIKELSIIHRKAGKNFRWQSFIRLYFRFRRMYWYLKRGGLVFTLKRIFK